MCYLSLVICYSGSVLILFYLVVCCFGNVCGL